MLHDIGIGISKRRQMKQVLDMVEYDTSS